MEYGYWSSRRCSERSKPKHKGKFRASWPPLSHRVYTTGSKTGIFAGNPRAAGVVPGNGLASGLRAGKAMGAKCLHDFYKSGGELPAQSRLDTGGGRHSATPAQLTKTVVCAR
jgi:hypothetical protein